MASGVTAHRSFIRIALLAALAAIGSWLLPPTLAAVGYAGEAEESPVIWNGGGAADDFIVGVPRFSFEIQADGEEHLVFGSNIFTPQQLYQFVTSLTDFIEEVQLLEPDQSLVLRQDGLYGYLALAATNYGGHLVFTLTLHAEAPSPVDSIAAIHGIGVDLGLQLLLRD